MKRKKEVKIKAPESEEDELDAMERERAEDLRARDEFALRLKEKDAQKTRQVVSKSGKLKAVPNVCHGLIFQGTSVNVDSFHREKSTGRGCCKA